MDYLLVLAHEVVADPARYMNLVQRIRRICKNPIIILDNGVVELGHVDAPIIQEAYEVVDPDYVVLPDKIGEFSESMKASKEFIREHGDLLKGRRGYMLVLQAMFCDTILSTVEHVARDTEWASVAALALPRHLTNVSVQNYRLNDCLSRAEVMWRLAAVMPHFERQFPVHMLGMSKSSRDDFVACMHPYVMGIDSANPIVAGFEGIKYTIHRTPHLQRQKMWDLGVIPDGRVLGNVMWNVGGGAESDYFVFPRRGW